MLESIVSLTKEFFGYYCLGFCGVTWYVLFRFLDWLKRNGNIRELKILDKATVVRDNGDSVFNKNLDEIVYFFERTKKAIVIFEDLDRFESSNIFVSLRELNYILNNYERIKKPIKFIYAIKDDMFVNKGERTKFFDFIIPIVPYISSTNSSEILRDKLQIDAEENTSKIFDISGKFVSLISPYINDMRDLICICNEFN